MKKKKDEITISSSAAEYLTYVASVGDQQDSVEMRYEDENIWLTQRMMATLYDVGLPTINEHIKKIYADSELEETATIRNFRIVQTEGSRQVTRDTKHYNLKMIIAVGFKVNSERAVQFRKWVSQIAKDYTIKGWVMDDERLKRGTYLTEKYFDEQLERIREIRASERKFYQKITDLYATAIDYDKNAATTRRFYATVQNKMHYAVHGHTAAELIVERADHTKEHMGLTTWADAPDGKIKKSDVTVAKNYLSQDKMKRLNRMVTAYLDFAENMTLRHIPLTMQDWEKRLNSFIEMLSNPVYTRRVAWGKRRTEKVPGKDNEYRLVKQDEYILSEVISHEAFVSKEDFDKVQEIKAIRGKKGNHNIGQYNAHLLSGIVKCPQCGAPMYIGMTKWTNQDGTERRTESYVCSYATKHRGTSVCRRNGVVASQVEDEVMEYTRKIVRNPQFIKDLQEKVMAAVDMTEVENDITAYKKQQSALQRSRDSLEQDIDRIAPDDKYAERRRADMTRRLNAPYDQNYKAEDLLQESLMKKATLESKQMSVQSMIGILSPFDAIYDRMNAAERRDLVKYLISEVELFPREEQKTQKRFVKAIAYKFPIEQKVLTQFDECGASVETVCLLVK